MIKCSYSHIQEKKKLNITFLTEISVVYTFDLHRLKIVVTVF